MIICGMEKFSMVDYPKKIACTVFTRGCNFRCPFCQNSGLVVGEETTEIIPESEIFDYLSLRRKMVDAVCVSGGEPTLQRDLEKFIRKCKDMGLLVKLDTNGSNPSVIKNLINQELLDFIAMDIKNCPTEYEKIIGLKQFDTSPIKQSVQLIMSSGVDYEFRTTLVDGYHTTDSMTKIGEWLSGAKTYRLQKFEDKGNNIADGLSAVPKAQADKFVEILKKSISDVELRNYN